MGYLQKLNLFIGAFGFLLVVPSFHFLGMNPTSRPPCYSWLVSIPVGFGIALVYVILGLLSSRHRDSQFSELTDLIGQRVVGVEDSNTGRFI